MSYSLGVYLTPYFVLGWKLLIQVIALAAFASLPYGAGYYIGRCDGRRNAALSDGACSDPSCPLAGVPREVL
jgi:hypothetical protein